MKSRSSGAKSTLAPAPAHPTQAIEPKFPALPRLPETLVELFRSLALTQRTEVMQPHVKGVGKAKKQAYAVPWVGFTSWKDARQRLEHFEKVFTGGMIVWNPFNDSDTNDGPMSLNAYPGRAFIERVTNEGDASLEAKALTYNGAMPASPAEAVARWFDLPSDALSNALSDAEARALARSTVTVIEFVGDSKDPKDAIFDARDYGVGLTSAEMPSTILSLNRGNKKTKPWLTGKHGQGASSTFQYADLTLIASRKVGSPLVAFTLVEARWDVGAKTPTYRYLTIDGKVPEIEVPETEFKAGTLVRHIGYSAADLSQPFGEHSLYGLLMRSLAEPLFPVWLEMFALRPTRSDTGYSTFTGYRRHGRLIRGTINVLERAWHKMGHPDAEPLTGEQDTADDEIEDDIDTADAGADRSERIRILHRASEFYELPQWNYGGREGMGDLGKVKINYWVADPLPRAATKEQSAGADAPVANDESDNVAKVVNPGDPPKESPKQRSSNDVLRNWVDPDKTIVFTLDGQTHAEESRAIITGRTGAQLWAVGRYMVVQIDCNGLDPRAKYELFTSTREHAKETPVKKMILEELVRRLSYDKRLTELNVKMAAADINRKPRDGASISKLIRQYLRSAGISFEQLTRKVEKWKEVEEERPATAIKPEPPPIPSQEPPTFVRWKFTGTQIQMYPGQRHSGVFETDARPDYWKADDQANSKIRVLAFGVRYVGAGEMAGGRVRCHFECPLDVAVGTKGCYIQVQLEYAPGNAIAKTLPVEIIEKPKARPKPKPSEDKKLKEGTVQDPGGSRMIKVKVRKKDFSEVEIPVVDPVPVKRSDSGNTWANLGWPNDPSRVGFSIRTVSGRVHLYYNAEFPPFLDMKHKMSKKSLEDEFVHRYELKLVLHTIFTLNYDFVDEESFKEDQRILVRDLLCATAESLALATKSELEIESRLKSEDASPLETAVAANLHDVATTAAGGNGAAVDV